MRLCTASSEVKWTALESWSHADVKTGNRSFREFEKSRYATVKTDVFSVPHGPVF